MKKLTARNQRGFTLIELMLAITIIVVLVALGAFAFNTVTRRTRNLKRTEDLKAIKASLDSNRTSAGFQVLNATDFEGGVVPVDPLNGADKCGSGTADCSYCSRVSGAFTTNCANVVSGSEPAANASSYSICTNYEGRFNGADFYCITP